MTLRKATRQKAKIRLGLSAVSGGGKTFSALLIAYGLVGDWNKIALIDTENGSGDLYAHLGDYSVLPLSKFMPEDYIAAIKDCEAAGMEAIIIDSITHEWEACLTEQDRLGGKYQDWAKVTPRHDKFKEAILQSTAHIITTVRRKQDYEMTKESNGKLKVEKAGLKEVTREGWEYELTANIELDTKHNATASKDRTGLFADKPSFIPSVETGKLIKEWCETGIDVQAEVEEKIKQLSTNVNTIEELKAFGEMLPEYISQDKRFREAAVRRKAEIGNGSAVKTPATV